MGSRTVAVKSVHYTDPGSGRVTVYTEGQTVPDGVQVGAHVFGGDGAGETSTPPAPAAPAAGTGGPSPAPVPPGPPGPEDAGQPNYRFDLADPIKALVKYAGTDQGRAQAVLDAEYQSEKPRKGLVEALRKVTEPDQ